MNEEKKLEAWKMAFQHWPNRQLIDCSYCNGIHPANELCAAKFHALSEG